MAPQAGPEPECSVLLAALRLIYGGEAGKAVEILAEAYGVRAPRVRIGLPRGCYRARACFAPGKWTIFFRDAEAYRDPFTVFHEFYHVLRFRMGRHRGNERLADAFAASMMRRAAACVGRPT